MKSLIAIRLAAGLGIIAAPTLHGQHYHLNLGAPLQSPGSPLYFQNGGSFHTNSAFVLPLQLATQGSFAGHYVTTAWSPTAIGTGFFNAPAPGTQARLRFVTVSGPPESSFGVWDVPGFNDEEASATSLTFSIPVGTINGTQSILLSQNGGEPDADPFGHIHGRAFSAPRPGLYVVMLQGYDASNNGANGNPVHAASETLPMYFQAGTTIAEISRTEATTTLTFATALGRTYYVQATTNLTSSASWQDIVGPLAGGNRLETATDSDTDSAVRFYRLRSTTP